MRRLQAFTLMELLIGMIISSIVIAFGYSAYTIIYQQYVAYRNVKREVLETMQLNTILNNDIIYAEYITYNDNVLKCNTANKQLAYYFMDSFIIRKENEASDTFKIATGNIVTSPVLDTETDSTDVINSILFDVLVLDTVERFVFTKRYSAQTVLNYEIADKRESALVCHPDRIEGSSFQ